MGSTFSNNDKDRYRTGLGQAEMTKKNDLIRQEKETIITFVIVCEICGVCV